MKKVFALIIATLTVFVFCSCKGGPNVISCYETPYNAQFFKDGYDYLSAEKKLNCENSDKISLASGHIPIHKIESVSELEKFESDYVSQFASDELKNHLDSYDKDFFKENILLIVNLYSGSGSFKYYISNIYISDTYNQGKDFTVGISQVLMPPDICVTNDIAFWLVTLEVKRAELDGVKSYGAVNETSHSYYGIRGDLYAPSLTIDENSAEYYLVYFSDSVRTENYGTFEKTQNEIVLHPIGTTYNIAFNIADTGDLVFDAQNTSKKFDLEISDGAVFEKMR